MGKKAKKPVVSEELVSDEMNEILALKIGDEEKKPRKPREITPHGPEEELRLQNGGVMPELLEAYSNANTAVDIAQKQLDNVRESRRATYRACVMDFNHRAKVMAKAGLKGAA